jgi:iron complex outermembrane receptor protein
LAVISTKRDGLYYNTTTKTKQDDKNAQALRAQLLFTPSDALSVRLNYDYAYQDPQANTQAFVRYGATLRPANTQFPALASAFNYAPPSTNPYDRLVDVNSAIQARQILQGLSVTVNYDLGATTFTSISAIRYWDWTPQNDRDFTSLSIRTKSSNNSAQNQWSQEFRLASNGAQTIDWVAGLYGFGQKVENHGNEEWGADAARWLIGTSVPSNLLTGYVATSDVFSETLSYALFGQATYNITPKLHVTGGLRYTYEEKSIDFTQTVSGGLATTDAALINRKNGIARNQAYAAAFVDQSPSGQISIAYNFKADVLGYVNVSKGFKSGGLNAAGIPTDQGGNPLLITAEIKPEDTTNVEIGLKSQWFSRALTLNIAAYATDITDYQANVVDSGPGSLRGYLANVDKVTVRGGELEARYRPNANLSAYASLSYTDGRYESFKNGPPPLEFLTATTASFDLSGRRLPGVSEWSGAAGFEYHRDATFGKISGEAYVGADLSYRSDWFSDASVSRYSLIKGSTLTNLRLGFRTQRALDVTLWIKNVFDEQYLSFTSIQAGNSGAIYGQPGDPRTFGVTLRKSF